MPLYEIFLITTKGTYAEQSPILLSALNSGRQFGGLITGVKYYGPSRLPYRIKRFDTFFYEGRYAPIY